jgi:hypothetical protein
MEVTKYEANLIAKLLEDRAAECNRNALIVPEPPQSIEVNGVKLMLTAQIHDDYFYANYAPSFEHYWNDQKDIASNLAIKYREEGKA